MIDFNALKHEFKDPDSSHVMVMPHRGGFLNDWEDRAPENSLANAERCIAAGFDGFEMDVCRSRDGAFVVMHDPKITRRSTGEGRTEDHSLAELRDFRLTYKNGKVSEYPISTLEEVLEAIKGRAWFKLHPKFELEHYPSLVKLLKRTDTIEQVVIWEDWRPGTDFHDRRQAFFTEHRECLEAGFFININALSELDAAWTFFRPPVIEIEFGTTDDQLFTRDTVSEIKRRGARVAANCQAKGTKTAGLSDDLAASDPDAAWGRLVDTGIRMLQTNEGERLLTYLRKREYRAANVDGGVE